MVGSVVAVERQLKDDLAFHIRARVGRNDLVFFIRLPLSRGGEIYGLVLCHGVFAFYNASNLRFETHVQHAVSLVENKVPDIAEGDSITSNQIDAATVTLLRQS